MTRGFPSPVLLCFTCAIVIDAVTGLFEQDVTKPLLITPLLKGGKVKEAQDLSKTDIGGVTSFTGFFTVNETCGNNLFFWFLQSEENWKDAPVLLWLNGGPGYTSMFGLFNEIGPFNHLKSGFVRRQHYWSKKFNVVFFDQPVGVGFSYSDKECYVSNMDDVGKDMTSALFQFFQMFPVLQDNKFFITGESYAGHYIPAIAMEVHNQNLKANVPINLKGIVIGNPYIDRRCIYIGDYLYELGIIDYNGREYTKANFEKYVKAITAKEYHTANELYDAAYGGKYLKNSQIPNVYNILTEKDLTEEYPFFLRDFDTRKKTHVGFTKFNNFNKKVFKNIFIEDWYISSLPRIEYLLKTNKYIVGLHGGQLDLVCLYSSIPCVVNSLKWSGSSHYFNSTRRPWYFSQRIGGWVKTGGNFFETSIRGGGHEVPAYQPEAALNLITAVVADEPGTPLLTRLNYSP